MIGLLVVAFGLRVFAALLWQAQASPQANYLRLGDSHGYWFLAQQIATLQPYEYGSPNASIFRAPLLPLLLAPLTLIADPWLAVFSARCLGAALGTLAVWLVSVLARRLAGIRSALAAAALAAFYPSAVGMSVLVLSEMLFVPLMLMHLLFWQSAWKAPSLGSRCRFAFLCGLVAGLAVLTRPSWLLFIPMMAIIGFAIGPRRLAHFQIASLSLLGLCLVMTPWWIRNASLTGKFVPTTLQVGPSLMDGLREGATGKSDQGMEFMQQIIQQQAQIDANAPSPLDGSFEWRVNRRATLSAIQWAAENPGEAIRLAGKKFCRTWSLWPDGNELASNRMKLAITTSFLAIFGLAVAGTWLRRGQPGWNLASYWMPCLYFTLLHMVFVGSIRYREPAMVALLALSGCAMAQLLRFLASRSKDFVRAES
jgi:4-amino-4-deoxy-L-arabinose transferase-like glycosyltransferase